MKYTVFAQQIRYIAFEVEADSREEAEAAFIASGTDIGGDYGDVEVVNIEDADQRAAREAKMPMAWDGWNA